MELKVYLPYPKAFITQRFADNATDAYAAAGLKGHTAYDWGVPWGTKIPNCIENAYCYTTMNATNPDPQAYRAAFFLVEGDNGYSDLAEVSYGHMSTVIAEVGKTYQVGETIGLIGNTGQVFVWDHEVTREEKMSGSKAGAHLHGPQIRPVKKVATRTKGKNYLRDDHGYYKKDGMFLEAVDFDNGYNGCINPFRPFSTETVATEFKEAVQIPDGMVPYEKALTLLMAANLPTSVASAAVGILKNVYKRH